MVQIASVEDISLETLQDRFDLQKVPYQDFFEEWQEESLPLSEFEQQQLAHIQQNCTNLAQRTNLSEEAVKMVVLSPLLDLADFYQAPFSLLTEVTTDIAGEDEGTVFRGKIDVLVALQQFWILAIESKNTRFDVMMALPCALSHMLGATNLERPVYGLLANGRQFVFVKLAHRPTPHYARSFALSIERDGLPWILGVLKRIRREILASN